MAVALAERSLADLDQPVRQKFTPSHTGGRGVYFFHTPTLIFGNGKYGIPDLL